MTAAGNVRRHAFRTSKGRHETRRSKEFAAEGAEVLRAGRNRSIVESLVGQIAEPAPMHAAAVDTLDEASVKTYVD